MGGCIAMTMAEEVPGGSGSGVVLARRRSKAVRNRPISRAGTTAAAMRNAVNLVTIRGHNLRTARIAAE